MPSSRLHYARSWKKFSCFCTLIGNTADLPISVPLLLWFIAHLFAGGAAPASIISVVAALSYFNKVSGQELCGSGQELCGRQSTGRGARNAITVRHSVTRNGGHPRKTSACPPYCLQLSLHLHNHESYDGPSGDSDAKIRAAGRWSSDAFKKYIRLV